MQYKTKDSHLKMKQRRGPKTGRGGRKTHFALQNKRIPRKNEAERRPQTKNNVDVSQKKDGQRDRREERAHFALQNKGFSLKNETKKTPETNITVDVAKKTREKM